MTNHCVCCGAEIPEGRIVCWACEHSEPERIVTKGDNTMSKKDIIRKLVSRKFWFAVAEFVTALLIALKKDKTMAQEIGSLIMLGAAPIAYMFSEGWADAGREKGDNYYLTDDEAHPPEN